MTREQIELCTAIGRALRKEQTEMTFTNIKSSWFTAEANGLLNIFFPFVEKFFDDKIKAQLSLPMMKQLLLKENLLFEFKRICEMAEKNNILILMIKGIYVKNYYPDPSQRTMIDIDLYYSYRQKRKVSQMMKSLGYDDIAYSMHHTLWFNPVNNITVEMHNSLFAEDGLGKSFYKELFNRAVPYEEYKSIYRMCDNDNYIYALTHLYKHYCHSTANLKQITDLYVMQLYAELSYNEIENEVKRLGLDEFYYCIKNIVLKLFESGENLSEQEEETADIITGNKKYSEENKDSWLINFLKTMFPKPSKIYVFFPYIYEHKWLLPFGYILRILKCLKTDKVFIKKKLSKRN